MAILLIVIIVLALIFDYINGFHDAANSIATIVSTKVLTPFQAVLWAALFNFVAFFIFKDHGVADTISKIVKAEYITLPVIISGIIAAIGWNLFTWWFGIPSSSSHTLIGGFAGAAIAHAGISSINPDPIIKTVVFIVVAPLIGMVMAFVISLWFINAFRKSILPKLVSLGIIAAVVTVLSFAMITAPSKIVGMSMAKQQPSKGVAIEKVFHSSPAQKMGIKNGDIILKVDQYEVNDRASLDKALLTYQRMNNINFTVQRQDETKQISNVFVTAHESKFWDIVFYGENFKWLLLGLIIIVMSIATLFLSSLSAAKTSIWLKRLQLVSSASFSIGHGGNDAQKVMGIITAALIAGGQIKSFEEMPMWVPIACYCAIAAGTMSGGWKIIKTMGTRITKVTPFEGVAAETAGAITLFVTEQLKIPVSTTHTVTGSIIGVGATKRLSAVRWGVTINLLWAWILTIPVSALMAAVVYLISTLF